MTAPAEPRSGGEAQLLRAEFERWHGRPGESAELVATVLAGLLDALPTPAWTSEAPKMPGWYWHRWEEGRAGIVEVFASAGGNLYVLDPGEPGGPRVDHYVEAMPGSLFAGPILPPASPEGAS